jgi:hypothetical protein
LALVDDVRSQLIPSFLSLAVVLVAAWLRSRRGREPDRSAIADRRVPVT